MQEANLTHYFERHDKAKNMARFYLLEIAPTLFGEICLIRRFGRIGTYGRRLEQIFSDISQAEAHLAQIKKTKLARGYQLGLRLTI